MSIQIWSDELCRELDAFSKTLTEQKRKGRLIDKEIDAALVDPKWVVDTLTAD